MTPHAEIRTAVSPFHAGEQAVQSRLGVRESIEPWARQIVRPFLPDQHRQFFEQLPFVVAAARDKENRPWVTLLTGPPGFVQSPDSARLHFATRLLRGDALEGSLGIGDKLGLLGIELQTRRRNRVNGVIAGIDGMGIKLHVDQSFGNCPQYITERNWQRVELDPANASVTRHTRLDREMQGWISSADTLFIATGFGGDNDDAVQGMDASHRGGAAGFVKIKSATQLVVPDYAGNNHFNTIGNLIMESGVGVLFLDFEKGAMLQISGSASIDWDSDEVANYPGARRLMVIDIEQIVRLDGVLPLRWSAPVGSVRSIRVTKKIKESDDVMSFEFIARDDGELLDFEAGQHLPIELKIAGLDQPVKRTYSLSNGPGEGHYRISVKRQAFGIASQHLHDTLSVGDTINCKMPGGDFVLPSGGQPVALISAGIGVTPLVSMLRALCKQDGSRPVYFIHGARDGEHHPLAHEVREIAKNRHNVSLEVVYSQPRSDDLAGENHNRKGHIDGKLIEEIVAGLDADFFLCGPARFLADITAALSDRGVAQERIHTETF